MTHIITTTEDRSAWLDARKGRLGASEIAIVAGLNKYKSPLQLWAERTGKVPSFEEENDAMWLGHELEPVAAKMFSRKTGLAVRPCGAMYGREDLPWAVATPDYWFAKDGAEHPLECKSTSQFRAAEWDGEIPDSAHLQLHFQMGILGVQEGAAAALIGGRDFAYQECTFRQDIFEQLVTLGEQFLARVKSDTPPPAMAGDATLVALLNGDIGDQMLTLEDEAAVLLVESLAELDRLRLEHEREVKPLKAQIEAKKALLQQLLGNSAGATVAQYVVTQKKRERSGYTVQPTSWVEIKVKEAK